MNHSTPEGRSVAAALAEAPVHVAAVRGCETPGCPCGLRPRVMIEIYDRTVSAKDRATAEGLVKSLQRAIEFAWGEEGGANPL